MDWILLNKAAKDLELSDISLYKRVFLLSENFEQHIMHRDGKTYVSSAILEQVSLQLRPDLSVWDEIARSVGFQRNGQKSRNALERELNSLKKELRRQDEMLRQMAFKPAVPDKPVRERPSFRKRLKKRMLNSIAKRLLALFRPAHARLT